jgi:response regulator RpfG family c-di-GMP phosphodiesterase
MAHVYNTGPQIRKYINSPMLTKLHLKNATSMESKLILVGNYLRSRRSNTELRLQSLEMLTLVKLSRKISTQLALTLQARPTHSLQKLDLLTVKDLLMLTSTLFNTRSTTTSSHSVTPLALKPPVLTLVPLPKTLLSRTT